MKITISLLLAFCALATASLEKRNYRTATVHIDGVDEYSKPTPRIITGHEAIPHSLPYQALLDLRGKSGLWSCSGSIISKHYILTSARCVDGAAQAHALLGVHNSFESEPTQVQVTAKTIKMHPDYKYEDSRNIYNDIALIEIGDEIPFNDYIQPIGLPTQEDIDDSVTFAGFTARGSGWGYTDMDADEYSDVLNYYDSKILKNSECKKDLPKTPLSQLCSFGLNNASTICQGDVGGPLVADYVQIGISSYWGFLCIDNLPSWYTRVSSYMSWIAKNSDVVIV